MAQHEKYHHRDLTYSLWHRYKTGDATLKYVDIDSCEYCHRCRYPLALIETAIDIGQAYKVTTVMRNLAEMAGIPAYLVFYKKIDDDGNIESFRVHDLFSSKRTTMTPQRYRTFLQWLHRNCKRCHQKKAA